MDFERASEIFESENVVDVFYKGKSIWIESLNSTDETAEISFDDDTKINISVNQLESARN